jgi:Uma2 family endonuclease
MTTQTAEALLLPNGQPLPTEPMTYEQFMEWLPDDMHAEWVDGWVVPMSPITGAHDELVAFLRSLLRLFLEYHPLGKLRGDPFQMKTAPHLPGRAPDLIFVANAHLPRLHRTFLEGPADIAIEVISPDSIRRDREDKFKEYELGGVPEYWLIDPERPPALFYQTGERGRYQVMPIEDGIFRSQVLPGFWLRVEWLWQEPLPGCVGILREWGLI